jgi:hypothetical protein
MKLNLNTGLMNHWQTNQEENGEKSDKHGTI